MSKRRFWIPDQVRDDKVEYQDNTDTGQIASGIKGARNDKEEASSILKF